MATSPFPITGPAVERCPARRRWVANVGPLCRRCSSSGSPMSWRIEFAAFELDHAVERRLARAACRRFAGRAGTWAVIGGRAARVLWCCVHDSKTPTMFAARDRAGGSWGFRKMPSPRPSPGGRGRLCKCLLWRDGWGVSVIVVGLTGVERMRDVDVSVA